MVRIERVDASDRARFRQMAEAYWQELMPRAEVIKGPERREAYFREEFAWEGGNNHPWWGLEDGCPVGFLTFEVCTERKRAFIGNFYVVREKRRRGRGSEMVRWLLAHLDSLGVQQIDLNVRRDTPDALAFWQAQGFGVASYRLRQYRDPQRGVAYPGALSSDR